MSRPTISLALAVAVLLLGAPLPAWGQEQPALPKEECEVIPDPELKWSIREKWVWEEICEGRNADLRFFQDKVLSERFLKTILLRAPFKDAIPETGVWIVGALFVEGLDFSNARIDVDLGIVDSQFTEPVSFARAEFEMPVGFHGSRFEKKLDLNGIRARKSLYLRNSQFEEVDLIGARVEGQVDMEGARFTGPLDMGSIYVRESLLMRYAEFALADPGDARTASPVNLLGAKIDGQVSMVSVEIMGFLEMESIQVGQAVLMRGAHFEKGVGLLVSQISGALVFSDGIQDATWGVGASLDMRQARLQVIEISEGSLPEKTPEIPRPLQLEGLQYQRLVAYASAGEVNTWNGDEYGTHWLEKSDFSPQTYKQLANALEREDRPERAAEILYASKEQQRARAKGLRWFNLTIQKLLIGYGYRIHLSLFWFAGLVYFGTLVHLSGQAKREPDLADFAESVFFSFDWLTPIVRLDEAHYKDPIPGWRRYYFAAHILIGFVLVSFILAGVSGLTK